jgi:hypothetical protein
MLFDIATIFVYGSKRKIGECMKLKMSSHKIKQPIVLGDSYVMGENIFKPCI